MLNTAVVRTTEHEISGADELEQFLVGAYGTSMRIRGEDDRHLLRHRRTEVGAVAVESARQSADLEFAVEPLGKIVVTRTSTSRLERASGGARGRYGAGELFIMSDPDLPYTARWLPGEIQNCVIDPAVLAWVAAGAPTRRPEPVRFTSLDPPTPAAAAQWWATRSYVVDLLGNPVAAAAPLVITSAVRLLAAATLAAFPNSAVTDPTIEDRRDAHPDTLRRAVTFIDEHAHTDITVADVAAAAHVTIRAVQLAFRRHLDTTPMDYLRQATATAGLPGRFAGPTRGCEAYGPWRTPVLLTTESLAASGSAPDRGPAPNDVRCHGRDIALVAFAAGGGWMPRRLRGRSEPAVIANDTTTQPP